MVKRKEHENMQTKNNDVISVKIIKCSSPGYWYRDYIGKVVYVKPVNDHEYGFVTLDGFMTYFIYKSDAVEFRRREKLEKIIKKIHENSGGA